MPFGCACFGKSATDDGPSVVAAPVGTRGTPVASSSTAPVDTKQAHTTSEPTPHALEALSNDDDSTPSLGAQEPHIPHTPEPVPSRSSRDRHPTSHHNNAAPAPPHDAPVDGKDKEEEEVNIWELVDPMAVCCKRPSTILTADAAKVIAAQHDALHAQGSVTSILILLLLYMRV